MKKNEPLSDYYALLALDRDASCAEIKRAFYRMAKRCHPDLNPSEAQSDELFKQISHAYHVLIDKKSRRDYDALSEMPKPLSAVSQYSELKDFPRRVNLHPRKMREPSSDRVYRRRPAYRRPMLNRVQSDYPRLLMWMIYGLGIFSLFSFILNMILLG